MKAIKIRHGNKGLSAATPLFAVENSAVAADRERGREEINVSYIHEREKMQVDSLDAGCWMLKSYRDALDIEKRTVIHGVYLPCLCF